MDAKQRPGEPWFSFLNDLDGLLEEPTQLVCIGGFAVVHAYGFRRSTVDIDVISVIPRGLRSVLIEAAGRESALRKKHSIYLDAVGVATAPESYQDRLLHLFPGVWRHLSLSTLEAHDLALTKLERNFERDRGDVEHLAKSGYLNANTLRARYYEEMRPYVIGRESWHDQTLEMWIEAYLTS